MKEENQSLQDQLKSRYGMKTIVGSSKVMQNLYTLIDRVCRTNATVLILGESGVGKERVAQTIHYSSNRADQPFIKVNCAALPESLIESELFGHEKGAFTGATRARKGRFEAADHGTIFLDEIGDLPLSAPDEAFARAPGEGVRADRRQHPRKGACPDHHGDEQEPGSPLAARGNSGRTSITG